MIQECPPERPDQPKKSDDVPRNGPGAQIGGSGERRRRPPAAGTGSRGAIDRTPDVGSRPSTRAETLAATAGLYGWEDLEGGLSPNTIIGRATDADCNLDIPHTPPRRRA